MEACFDKIQPHTPICAVPHDEAFRGTPCICFGGCPSQRRVRIGQPHYQIPRRVMSCGAHQQQAYVFHAARISHTKGLVLVSIP